MSETYIYAESLQRILIGIAALLLGTVFASLATLNVEHAVWTSAFFGWIFTFAAVGGGVYLLWRGFELYDEYTIDAHADLMTYAETADAVARGSGRKSNLNESGASQ